MDLGLRLHFSETSLRKGSLDERLMSFPEIQSRLGLGPGTTQDHMSSFTSSTGPTETGEAKDSELKIRSTPFPEHVSRSSPRRSLPRAGGFLWRSFLPDRLGAKTKILTGVGNTQNPFIIYIFHPVGMHDQPRMAHPEPPLVDSSCFSIAPSIITR